MEIKKLDKDKCKNLKDLFIEWHERHEEDVNELRIEVNKLKVENIVVLHQENLLSF